MNVKDRIIQRIQTVSRRRLGLLTRALARPDSPDRETVLAGIEFERWIMETCEEAGGGPDARDE